MMLGTADPYTRQLVRMSSVCGYWMGERLVDVEEGVLDMSGAECPAYMLW